jgi:UDP-4-amino-4,6-dideoxy-N-acetyl-beta-L-altrosamine N-acetyltransferase
MKFVPLLDCPSAVQDEIRTLRNKDYIRKYMYTSHEISEEEHAKWLHSLRGNAKQAVFVVMLQGKTAGLVSLNAINATHKTADWAFYIDESLQGKGVGSLIEFKLLDHAFNAAGLEKLNCEVLEVNPSVVKMHQKFGFSVEGIRRKNIARNDGRIDVVLLGITKDEWAVQRPSMLKLAERIEH